MQRSEIIGGSDIAAIVGVSRYKTPLQLWAEKKGILKRETTEAMELGTELEGFVAKKFEKVTGLVVRRDRKEFKHKEYPYLVGHIDRRIVGQNELLECKTTSAWKAKEWVDDEIPEEYILQVNWYLGLTGMEKGYIACLIGGQKFIWKVIHFDQELYEACVKSAVDFYENYLTKDNPPVAVADDNPILAEIYKDSGMAMAVYEGDAPEINKMLDERELLSLHIRNLEKQKGDIEAKIKQFLGENNAGETDKYRFYWKETRKKVIDYNRLKEDKIFEDYAKEIIYRNFRIYKKKGENNG